MRTGDSRSDELPKVTRGVRTNLGLKYTAHEAALPNSGLALSRIAMLGWFQALPSSDGRGPAIPSELLRALKVRKQR